MHGPQLVMLSGQKVGHQGCVFDSYAWIPSSLNPVCQATDRCLYNMLSLPWLSEMVSYLSKFSFKLFFVWFLVTAATIQMLQALVSGRRNDLHLCSQWPPAKSDTAAEFWKQAVQLQNTSELYSLLVWYLATQC